MLLHQHLYSLKSLMFIFNENFNVHINISYSSCMALGKIVFFELILYLKNKSVQKFYKNYVLVSKNKEYINLTVNHSKIQPK